MRRYYEPFNERARVVDDRWRAILVALVILASYLAVPDDRAPMTARQISEVRR